MTMRSTTTAMAAETSCESGGGAAPSKAAAKRIAIVEDELIVAWSLESMAEELGHQVIGIFPTGEAALAGISGEPPDLVFMDINLGGGIDGIETARRMRGHWPVPILFISAYADRETRDRALDAAPEALLLGKPVAAEALASAIETLTGSKG